MPVNSVNSVEHTPAGSFQVGLAGFTDLADLAELR